MKKVIIFIEVVLLVAVYLMSLFYIPWGIVESTFDGLLAIILTLEVFNIFLIIAIVSLAFYLKAKKDSEKQE